MGQLLVTLRQKRSGDARRSNAMNRLNENQDEIPTELSELLSELQADRGVQLSLEVPQIRQRCYSEQGGPQKDQQVRCEFLL